MNNHSLILASASPRRKELLGRLCERFEVVPCPLSEPQLRSDKITAQQWAPALAYFKARAVADLHPECWILGADTVVACDGQMLGKPRDVDDARRMLELQARHVSEVVTGVCLLHCGAEQRRVTAVDTTRVWMRDDIDLREEYLAGGDWVGKAGAYGIQTVGDQLVKRYEGSFSNVVGLPLELLERLLADLDVPVRECNAGRSAQRTGSVTDVPGPDDS